MTPDLTPDPDITSIERTATSIMDSLLTAKDLGQLRDQIAVECAMSPVRMAQVRMAQVIMCLAAWSDMDETTGHREQRVEQINVLRAAS